MILVFQTERWRLGAAIVWSVLLTPLFLTVFLIVGQASLSFPVFWLIGMFHSLLPILEKYIHT